MARSNSGVNKKVETWTVKNRGLADPKYDMVQINKITARNDGTNEFRRGTFNGATNYRQE